MVLLEAQAKLAGCPAGCVWSSYLGDGELTFFPKVDAAGGMQAEERLQFLRRARNNVFHPAACRHVIISESKASVTVAMKKRLACSLLDRRGRAETLVGWSWAVGKGLVHFLLGREGRATYWVVLGWVATKLWDSS